MANAFIALLTAISLTLVFIAIRRSPKKLETVFYIVVAVLACDIIGAVIGLASVNPNAAVVLVMFSLEIGALAILRFIAIRGKPKTVQGTFYIVTVILACGIVGAVIRLAFVSSHAAGTLVELSILVGAVAVSIEQIRKHRNSNVGL